MVLSGAAASIHGAVTDTSGSPLDSIRIKIFDVSSGVFVLKTRTDSAGQYAFPVVNPGTYFVRADADETPYEDVWYVNSHELAGATPVVVAESSDVAVNFMLSGEQAVSLENHNVTGIVRDSSGIPIAGASVSLMKLSGDYGDDDDFFDDDSRSRRAPRGRRRLRAARGHRQRRRVPPRRARRRLPRPRQGAGVLRAVLGRPAVAPGSQGPRAPRRHGRDRLRAGPEDRPGSTAPGASPVRSGAPTTWRRCAPRCSAS